MMGSIKSMLKIIAVFLSFVIFCLPFSPITEGVLNSLSIDSSSYVDFSSEFVTGLLLKTGNKFDTDTNETAIKIIRSVIVQFMTGDVGEETITSALSELPFEDKERENPQEYITENPLSDSVSNALSSSSILPENIKSFLTMYSKGINDLYAYFMKTDYDNIYEFAGSYVDNNGNIVKVQTGVYYDKSTGCVYGKDNNGIFGIGYDFNAKDYVIYNPSGAWMKDYGYNIIYDIVGESTFMDCEYKRIKFDYDGVSRMVQLWKGNYTPLTNGAEVGLYYLEDGKYIHYTCAYGEDYQLTMSMSLYNGDGLIFEREPISQWWLSGFKIGPAVDKSEMTLKGTIDFGNSDYADAFFEAAKNENLEVKMINSTVIEYTW